MRCQRGLIFVNGELPNDQAALAMLQADDVLIAADGGARHLARLGLMPHMVVGDLDSLSEEEVEGFERAGVELRRYPRKKDETDLELALREAHESGCREIIIVAGLGGRIDQALGNLYLLLQPFMVTLDARLDDGQTEAFWIHHQGVVRGRPGDLVSLLPLMGPVEGIVTRGLLYPLRGETLYPDRTRGISNAMEAEEATIALSRGALMCIHMRNG